MSFWQKHAIFEKNSIILVIGVLIVISFGVLMSLEPAIGALAGWLFLRKSRRRSRSRKTTCRRLRWTSTW